VQHELPPLAHLLMEADPRRQALIQTRCTRRTRLALSFAASRRVRPSLPKRAIDGLLASLLLLLLLLLLQELLLPPQLLLPHLVLCQQLREGRVGCAVLELVQQLVLGYLTRLALLE
jgi:hypothetical protein